MAESVAESVTESVTESGGDLPGGWAWDERTLRAAAHRVAELAADHIVGLPEGPVFRPVPGELADRWRGETWAAGGAGIEELLAELEQDVLRFPFGNGHPRFHAWVNSPPDRAALLVNLLASAADPSCAGGNHAALHIERLVIRWLADMVGLPAAAGGLLLSGGSMATVTALAAAREAHAPFDVRADGLAAGPPLTVYAGTEAHSAVTKAVELLGLRRNLRLVASAPGGSMPACSTAPSRPPPGGRSIRSPSSRAPGRPARVRSTRSARSPMCARAMTSGCTWTAPTARQRSSPSASAPTSPVSRAPTAWRSTRTSGCTSRSTRARCSSATPSGSGTPSVSFPPTSGFSTTRPA